jgi:hypothetical protein
MMRNDWLGVRHAPRDPLLAGLAVQATAGKGAQHALESSDTDTIGCCK